MKKTMFFILFFLGIAASAEAETKSVTLRSYYPPPMASFDRIKLVPRNSTVTLGAACPEVGTMFRVSSNPDTIYYCQGDLTGTLTASWQPFPGVWAQQGTKIYLSDHSLVEDANGDGIADGSADLDNNSIADIDEAQVAVGTSTPIFRLTMMKDGAIIASGNNVQVDSNTPGTGDDLVTTGAGTRLIWYAKKAAFRAGGVDGSQWNHANIGVGSVAMGYNTCATSYGAMVKGGHTNTTSTRGGYTANPRVLCDAGDNAFYSTIGGGRHNTVSREYSVIIGGGWNRTFAPYSFIGGGGGVDETDGNLIETEGINSAIGGGRTNKINFSKSLIIGGQENELFTTPASAANEFCVIGGGYQNKMNHASAAYSIIFGGYQNTLQHPYSVIGGGQNNTLANSSSYSANPPTHNTIGGGQSNTIAWAQRSTIVGGQSNSIDITGNAIVTHSLIGGGKGNQIWQSNNFSAIVGGENNKLKNGNLAFIGGGKDNEAGGVLLGHSPDDYMAICGGEHNIIISDDTLGVFPAFIGGGAFNTIARRKNFVSILGGSNNTMRDKNSFVAGRNMIVEGENTFVWGYHDTAQQTTSAQNSFIIYNSTGSRVGIGTATPAHTLDVNGNVKLSGGKLILESLPAPSSSPVQLKYNSANITANDLAETFTASEKVETGDVLVIDPAKENRLRKSRRAYDNKVLGVVSGAPAILFEGSQMVLSPKPFEFTKGKKPPVALKGRVLVKISTENGPIMPGDALTTSATAGHAMKASDKIKANGAIIGKALAGFSGGGKGETFGMIPVLVTIH